MRSVTVAAALLAFALAVLADTVVPRQGQPVEGKVVLDDGNEVVVNPYFSKFPEMVWKTVRLPKNGVARVDLTPESPFQEFWRRSAALKADDAAGWVELAKFCQSKKLDPEMKEAAAWALAAAPDDADARALLGAEAEKLLKSSPRHNPELKARIADYAALDPADRKAAHDAMKKEFGVKEPREWFDRVARSMEQPKGFRKDVALTISPEKSKGIYCIYVPDDYDPLRPWPLVVGLHGGGPAGKDGKGVVGNGPDFYPFLDGNVRRRGYITVCPTANAAPWSSEPNDGLFTGLIQEIQILFNIDLNRVYLIGHSMGGFGTWHFGPKYAEKFAAFAPAAGGGHNGESKLAGLGTGVYVYHSDDDPRCAVGPDREAADLLKKSRADFIYTELPGKGHSWPSEVVDDTFDFFDRHRLMVKAGKQPAPSRGPRSSFLERMTAEEMRAFPPAASGGTGGNTVRALLTELARGGGNAEKAARQIAEKGDRAAVIPLATLLSDRKSAEDVRLWSAWTLGELKDAKAVTALASALADEALKVRRNAAEALAKVGDARGAAPLAAAIDALGKYFDSRMQRNAIDLTDWENVQDLNAAFVVALASFGDAKTAQPVVAVSIRRILCSKVDVDWDRQVQDSPEVARRKAALTLIPALPLLKASTLAAELPLLRETFSRENAVLEAIDAADAAMQAK
ncbi:MAG: HEAT repeat domain-containing protein [Candidatus Brocadiae bacterium]|nr:HEAT repeat domain-containing protein [Candidatus Brocadiia bacterium]